MFLFETNDLCFMKMKSDLERQLDSVQQEQEAVKKNTDSEIDRLHQEVQQKVSLLQAVLCGV